MSMFWVFILTPPPKEKRTIFLIEVNEHLFDLFDCFARVCLCEFRQNGSINISITLINFGVIELQMKKNKNKTKMKRKKKTVENINGNTE